MEALMAIVSILAIVAGVLVVGGLIAFVGHMIIGAFDFNKSTAKSETKDTVDYSQYKQLEDTKQAAYNAEYDFEAINQSKAEKEKSLLEKESLDIYALEDDKDDELEEIENRLKEAKKETEETPVVAAPVEQPAVQETTQTEEDDDFDLDDLLSEISDEVIEEEKADTATELKMSDELESYSIDDMLKRAEEEELDETPVENAEEVAEELVEESEVEEEPALEVITTQELDEHEVQDAEEPTEDQVDEDIDDILDDDILDEDEDFEEDTEEVVKEKILLLPDVNPEIESLKAQLAELNKQLELARAAKVEVVKLDITEEECLQKIEVLEERLKNVKKDYKINMKEYRPLKKVMNDLERYQTKLRRKEAVVAKKKVALYGVNNYVDIDKEKAEKLANELELLDGLRLSVNHCEEVINANKDRFPILEHSNQILENQIAHLEADLAEAQETLKKIREKNGNGNNEGNNEGNTEE